MKTLVNCTPREFLTQTVKIKKAVANWLTATDIMNIRKRKPVLAEGLTKEQERAAYMDQARANISAMLDSIMEAHPDETLELLALMCFIDPKNVDEHPMDEYLTALNEMMGSEAVLGFFMSFQKLAQTGILRG